jgi:hypothetical protein
VIDRVFQDDLTDAGLAATVREIRRIAEQSLERVQIAPLVRMVQRKRVTHHVRTVPPAW